MLKLLCMICLAQPYLQNLQSNLGVNNYRSSTPQALPENQEELDLHMQLSYKQSIEIAEEEVIDNTLGKNRFENIKRRFNYDLVTLGIGAVKTDWNSS